MKYYLIAGEASGDLHGSHLVRAILEQDTEAVIHCWGGDLMQTAGTILDKHYKELAFMGFVEVVRNVKQIKQNFSLIQQDLLQLQPDIVILIDYAGFNLRVAPIAKKMGCTVCYYIPPKVWAWNAKRALKLKEYCDHIFTIFPFETQWYHHNYDMHVDYVGNPLLDELQAQATYLAAFKKSDLHIPPTSKPLIALLPGSRQQEIKRLLPLLSQLPKLFSDYQFVIAAAPALSPSFYEAQLQDAAIPIVYQQTYPLLKHAVAAIVTSGTATLETALLNVPQVVIYRANELSYQIAKRLVKLRHISLVNLILEQTAVTELIQDNYHIYQLRHELAAILPGGFRREQVLESYEKLGKMMGDHGASERVAKKILKTSKK